MDDDFDDGIDDVGMDNSDMDDDGTNDNGRDYCTDGDGPDADSDGARLWRGW